MTTGEKLAALRKEKEITQEQLAEMLGVSRQSVSRWEMDAAFPETEKLIRLSKILGCSIDFLLRAEMTRVQRNDVNASPEECFRFIRECGYFFLATALENKPHLRPMGMIGCDSESLYLATDDRKSVYAELTGNPHVELASYHLNTRKWIRITGTAERDTSEEARRRMTELYPMIGQEYVGKEMIHLAIFRLTIDNVRIN